MLTKNTSNQDIIVLTADRTLMTEYNGILDLGHFACLPCNLIPNIIRHLFYPPLNQDLTTYSLRRVESSLIDQGYNVITLNPQQIHKIKKIKPKIIGISVVDPLSIKPHSWTLKTIFGGDITVTEDEFTKLLTKIHKYNKNENLKIIIGGPGASEFDSSEKYHHLFNTYVIGPGEGATELFTQALNNQPLPKRYIADPILKEGDIPFIRKPTRLGAVQITQGCPRECDFCAVATQKWLSFSKERILKEININLQRNYKQISLISEDILLYGSHDLTVNHQALTQLMQSFADIKKKHDVKRITFSNISVAATINGKKTVKKITEILNVQDHNPVSPVIGLETGSTKLIKKYMQRKAEPYNPDDWTELVTEAITVLNDNHWYPQLNLITGLPEETEDDVIDTINLLDDMFDYDVFYYIFFFSPAEGTKLEKHDSLTFENLTERRWELIQTCWKKTLSCIKSDIGKFVDHKIKQFLFLNLMAQFEKELNKYKNNPFAFRDKYANLNLHGIQLIKYITRALISYQR